MASLVAFLCLAGYLVLILVLSYVSKIALIVLLAVSVGGLGVLAVYGGIRNARINALTVRERAADWPILNRWANEHGWRVRYRELIDWADRLSYSVSDGPYLTVSGQVNCFAVDVIRVPWYDNEDNTRGVHHVVAVMLPDHAPADIRARGVRASIKDGTLVATMHNMNFEFKPTTVLPAVEQVLDALERHDAELPDA
jgi:hypothetical protein